jgi:PncC family amidohydrolase
VSLYMQILELARSLDVGFNTVESITAGGIGAAFVKHAPGASDVFREGLAVYSDAAKIRHGLDPDVLKSYGSISKETTAELALVGNTYFDNCYTVALTGQAQEVDGPPKGTVFIAVAFNGEVIQEKHVLFEGKREEIIDAAIEAALKELKKCLEKQCTA